MLSQVSKARPGAPGICDWDEVEKAAGVSLVAFPGLKSETWGTRAFWGGNDVEKPLGWAWLLSHPSQKTRRMGHPVLWLG